MCGNINRWFLIKDGYYFTLKGFVHLKEPKPYDTSVWWIFKCLFLSCFAETWQRDSVNWFKSLARKSKMTLIKRQLLQLLVKNICRVCNSHLLSTRWEAAFCWSFVGVIRFFAPSVLSICNISRYKRWTQIHNSFNWRL